MAKQVVLITGCSGGGIGAGICEAFHKRGLTVVASARKIGDLKAFADKGMMTVQLDVTDEKSIAAAVDAIIAKHGRIDILVNNAGYGQFGPLVDQTYAELKALFDTNVFGLMAAIRAVVPHMARQGGGKIVNVGSVSGLLSTPFGGSYAATKAAVHSMSDALRVELKPFNIDVIVAAPGPIKTNFSNKSSTTPIEVDSDSLYVPAMDAIAERAKLSQKNATPHEVYADATVSAILAGSKPYLFYGLYSHFLKFAAFHFPYWLRDAILFRMSGMKNILGALKERALGKPKKE